MESMLELTIEKLTATLTKTFTNEIVHQGVDQYKMIKEVLENCKDLSMRLNAVVEQNTCMQKRVAQLKSEREEFSVLGKSITKNRVNYSEPKPRKKQTVASKSSPRSKVSYSNSIMPSHTKTAFTKDPCGVLVSGVCHLSKLSKLTNIQIVNRLLTFAGLSNLISHVVSTRSWKPKFSREIKSKLKSQSVSDFVVKFASPLA